MKFILLLLFGLLVLLSSLWFFVSEREMNDPAGESGLSLVEAERQVKPRDEGYPWAESEVSEKAFDGVSADFQAAQSKGISVKLEPVLSRLRELEVGSVVSLHELFGIDLDRYYMINHVEVDKYGVNVRGDILDGYKGMGINASFSEGFVFGQYATEDGNYLFESHGNEVVLSLVKHDKGDEVDVD